MMISLGGVPYEACVQDLVWTSRGPDEIEITHRYAWESYNRCDCCGRFDSRQVIARSWAEAEQFGWIRKVEP